MLMAHIFGMYLTVLCSYSTLDPERKQQCMTLDNENDLGNTDKWQTYQMHETCPSPIRQLLSLKHLKVLF